MKEKKGENLIAAKHISGANWKWTLCLPEMCTEKDADFAVILTNIENNRKCVCPFTILENSSNEGGITIEVDLSPLKETVDNCRESRWRVYCDKKNGDIELPEQQLYDPYRAALKTKRGSSDPFKLRREFIEEPVGSMAFEGRAVEAVPYCNNDGSWTVDVGDQCLRYMRVLRCICNDSGLKGSKLHFRIACPVIEGITWTGVTLTYRYQLEKDRTDYFFPFKYVHKDNNHLVAEVFCDIEGLDFRTVYWDVRPTFEMDGTQYWCLLKSAGANRTASQKGGAGSSLRNLFKKQTLDIGGNYQMSIGETKLGNTSVVVQESSPFTGFAFRFKERLAIVIYMMFRGYLRRKKIFLVYEKFCEAAQENGLYFFKYCMDNGMERSMNRSIYYVIDKNQKDYVNLLPYKDHVIQFMSFKHMVYILAARLLISSDSKLHAYAWRASESIIRPRILEKKKLVFLQHGVIGIKRVPIFKKGQSEGADLFITSNEMERGFIINDLDYAPEQVVVTGLARWDVLKDSSSESEHKHILLMPTWRNWLNEPTEEVFLASEYYHRYMDLLNSKRLAEILEKNDLYMDFFIHPKLSEYLSRFSATTGRISLIPFGSKPLNRLMMRCKTLITDYSSVCWDVYYQGKPVIFYQFDLAEYNETQGAYMDLENDLFGDRAETQEMLLDLLEETVENDFTLKPEYEEMRERLFKYIDRNNSRRICEEIMKRGW